MGSASKLRALVGSLVLVSLLVGAVGVGTTSAQSDVITATFDTSYNGTDGGGSQAVEVTATFTANGDVSGLLVNVNEFRTAFVEEDSFVTSSGPNVDPQPVDGNPGSYRVESLSSGQQFSVSFEAYPKRLDKKQLRVATYRMEAENPQTFSDEGFITADLSSSPYLKYGEVSLFADFGLAGFVGAIVLGLVGLVAAAYTRFFDMSRKLDAKDDEFVDQLETLKRKLQLPDAKDEVDDVIDEYDDTEF